MKDKLEMLLDILHDGGHTVIWHPEDEHGDGVAQHWELGCQESTPDDSRKYDHERMLGLLENMSERVSAGTIVGFSLVALDENGAVFSGDAGDTSNPMLVLVEETMALRHRQDLLESNPAAAQPDRPSTPPGTEDSDS